MKPKAGEIWKFVPAEQNKYSVFPSFGNGAGPVVHVLQPHEEFMILEVRESYRPIFGDLFPIVWANIISTEVDKIGWIIFRHSDGKSFMEKVCD